MELDGTFYCFHFFLGEVKDPSFLGSKKYKTTVTKYVIKIEVIEFQNGSR